jgi:aerobic-type carbon monoxide dehydrogenase small subunit (CoxS/CutS family)
VRLLHPWHVAGAKALLDETHPTRQEVKAALANLCRCRYVKIVDAVLAAAESKS